MPLPIGITEDGKFISADDIALLQRQVKEIEAFATSIELRLQVVEARI